MTPSTDRRLRLATLAATPIVVTASAWYADAAGAPATAIAGELVVAGSFLVTGFLAWHRRPANRMGRLMVALALSQLLSAFAGPGWPLVAPFGLLCFTLASVLLGYLMLAYPSGVLGSTANRTLVGVTAFLVGGPRLLRMLARDPAAQGLGYENPYLLIRDPGFSSAMTNVPYLLDIVVLAAFVGFVAVRWARATGAARRTLSPVLVPTMGLLLLLLAATAAVFTQLPVAAKESLTGAQLLARAVIPVGFLFGLLRTRMARSAVADLVVELGRMPDPARLRETLANSLGDPTLSVGYWTPPASAFLDPAGQPVELPADGSHRAVTILERDGAPLAAIVHDPVLLEDPGLMDAVAGALRLAVENERLHVLVDTQLDEVRASRARIVAAGDAERKRVERDLHDGAQQRLVSLTLALRLARTKLGEDADPAVRITLDHAAADARAALAELRELARGIHPQILTEAGLGPAIESLADRSPVHVSVDVTAGRFSSAAEGAAYFVISEALANVAKYARATRTLVSTGWQDGRLTVEIADDGIGGADPASGSGLRGLVDRVAAVDGTLEIVSPRGGGTRLIASIPTALMPQQAGSGA